MAEAEPHYILALPAFDKAPKLMANDGLGR